MRFYAQIDTPVEEFLIDVANNRHRGSRFLAYLNTRYGKRFPTPSLRMCFGVDSMPRAQKCDEEIGNLLRFVLAVVLKVRPVSKFPQF